MDRVYIAKDGRPVVAGRPCLDWVSATTRSGDAFEALTLGLQEMFPDSQTRAVIQRYTGINYTEGVFLGSGYQQGQAHFLLQVSGLQAELVIGRMRQDPTINLEDWSLTRIDIQVTLRPKRRRMPLHKLGVNLQKGKYGKISNRREIDVRTQSSATGDTIYVGGVSSEKMRRIYSKSLVDSNGVLHDFERYEIQFRHGTAKSLMKKINVTDEAVYLDNLVKVLRGDATSLPHEFVKRLAISNWNMEEEGTNIARAAKQKGESNTTKWIFNIRKALEKGCKQEGKDGEICRGIMFDAIFRGMSTDPLADNKGCGFWIDEQGNLHPFKM